MLISVKPAFGSYFGRLGLRLAFEMNADRLGVERHGHPQRPPQGTAPHCLLEALERWVERSAPSRCPSLRVRDDDYTVGSGPEDHSQ